MNSEPFRSIYPTGTESVTTRIHSKRDNHSTNWRPCIIPHTSNLFDICMCMYQFGRSLILIRNYLRNPFLTYMHRENTKTLFVASCTSRKVCVDREFIPVDNYYQNLKHERSSSTFLQQSTQIM